MLATDILLVEDDKRLAELTAEYLRQQGFSVVVEGSGTYALDRFRQCSPALVLLDLTLPGKDGLDICRELRAEFEGPILLLTARGTSLSQVVGLEAGADDYVIKPADPMVLLARIRALLRRPKPPSSRRTHVLCVGNLHVQLASRQVLLGSQEMTLTSLEFEILRVLVEHVGTVVSREQLHRYARGVDYDGMDRTIDIRISRLRKKLGDNLKSPYRIKTVWGKGYLLAADVWE